MDRTVRERFARIREMADHVEEAAGSGRWDSAIADAVTLNSDAAFIKDWLCGQAGYVTAAAAGASADIWEPPPEPSLENITEPLSGTLDADAPIPPG